MRRRYKVAIPLAVAALAFVLFAPAALADSTDLNLAIDGKLPSSVGINTIWVIVAGSLVMFMQAGFAFLEIGFSRGKNVGAVGAKILTNFSVAAIVWWAIGVALAFGGGSKIAGDHGFFLNFGDSIPSGIVNTLYGDTLGGAGAGFFFFQFVFCAVSLAIVWGTTLERIKFIAYPIYAIVFAGVIYPLIAHWIFG